MPYIYRASTSHSIKFNLADLNTVKTQLHRSHHLPTGYALPHRNGGFPAQKHRTVLRTGD